MSASACVVPIKTPSSRYVVTQDLRTALADANVRKVVDAESVVCVLRQDGSFLVLAKGKGSESAVTEADCRILDAVREISAPRVRSFEWRADGSIASVANRTFNPRWKGFPEGVLDAEGENVPGLFPEIPGSAAANSPKLFPDVVFGFDSRASLTNHSYVSGCRTLHGAGAGNHSRAKVARCPHVQDGRRCVRRVEYFPRGQNNRGYCFEHAERCWRATPECRAAEAQTRGLMAQYGMKAGLKWNLSQACGFDVVQMLRNAPDEERQDLVTRMQRSLDGQRLVFPVNGNEEICLHSSMNGGVCGCAPSVSVVFCQGIRPEGDSYGAHRSSCVEIEYGPEAAPAVLRQFRFMERTGGNLKHCFSSNWRTPGHLGEGVVSRRAFDVVGTVRARTVRGEDQHPDILHVEGMPVAEVDLTDEIPDFADDATGDQILDAIEKMARPLSPKAVAKLQRRLKGRHLTFSDKDMHRVGAFLFRGDGKLCMRSRNGEWDHRCALLSPNVYVLNFGPRKVRWCFTVADLPEGEEHTALIVENACCECHK